MRLRIKKSKRNIYCLIGGPYCGDMVLLPQETMVFTAKGMTGRYVMGRWESVR